MAAVAILVAAAVMGCSKSTSPTNPYGGGGTGGTPSGNASFDSGSLSGPASYVHVFAVAGAVGYHCNFHASMGMTGMVNVVSGAADSATVSASGTSFTPASVTIKPGGQVRWNITGGPHTVTSD